jgi:glycosyltransferase involved in cell wall biosynthesis
LEEVRSAYAAARVHVLPSFSETCGLVTMEAALADCNTVASMTGCEVEYFHDLVYYCDPIDPISIRQAVLDAYNNYDADRPRRAALKKLILDKYNWPQSSQRILRVYEQVITTAQKKRM